MADAVPKVPKMGLPKLPALNFKAFKLPFPAAGAGSSPSFKIPGISFLAQKPKNITVVEIGEEWVKVVTAQKNAKEPQIVFVDGFSIKELSEVEISQKLMQLMRQNNFKSDEVFIAHPTHALTIRMLSLPSVDPKEIKDIVELQAVKQTPYTREEITSGFHLLNSDASGYSSILLAISHRDTVSKYYRIAEMSGLSARTITASVEGQASWFNLSGKGKEPDQTTLLLDIDWLSSDLLILNGGKLCFCRSIPFGAKQIQEQGAAAQMEFIREVQRSVESGEAELKGNKISQVVLAGTQAPLKDLLALIARELNLPCEILPALAAYGGKLSDASEKFVESFTASLLSVIGLVLNPGAAKINLIPSEIRVRHGLEERARDLAHLGTLLLAIITVISMISFEKIYKRSSYLGQLKKEYGSVAAQSDELERLVNKMKLAREQISHSDGVLDVFKDINEVIPDDIILTSFEYNANDKSILLRGTAQEMSAVFQFLSTLESTPQLEQVKTRNVTKRKVGEKDVAEFEIVASIGEGGSGSGGGGKSKPAAPSTETVLSTQTVSAPEVGK